MSDHIINRETLKRHCEATCEKFKDVPTSGIYGEHKLVLDLLKQTEWIPVSERLPEKEDDYLVTDIDKEIHKVRFYFPLDRREPYFSGGYKIVAWMPLPEPYKANKCDI